MLEGGRGWVDTQCGLWFVGGEGGGGARGVGKARCGVWSLQKSTGQSTMVNVKLQFPTLIINNTIKRQIKGRLF